MISPTVETRIEQLHDPARFGVNRRHVRPLSPVTVKTRQSQVGKLSFPAVLLGDDVVHFVRPQGSAIRDSAVFAALSRAMADLGA